MRARHAWMLAALAACGGAQATAAPKAKPVDPNWPRKVKPVDVVLPEKVAPDVYPESDELAEDDHGYAWATATAVGAGGLDRDSVTRELEGHEDALEACFVEAGIDYLRLDLQVTWDGRGFASASVEDADPEPPSTAVTDCLANVFGSLYLSTGLIGTYPTYPAEADITVERGFGSEGGAVGGVVGGVPTTP
jgi:hypothetical protein